MSREAFFDDVQRLYEAERSTLFAYALTIAGSSEAAEDAVQTAIQRLLRRGRAPRELRPYLFRAIRNAALDHRRWRSVNGLPPVVPGACEVDGLPRQASDPTLRPTLLDELAQLRPEVREAVLLKTVGGFTLREIAAVRRRSQNTVASWVRRGLDKLRTALEESR